MAIKPPQRFRAAAAHIGQRPAVQFGLRIVKGSLDEACRLWLRQAEMIEKINRRASEAWQPTFFDALKRWRSNRGYFRLFRDLDGTTGRFFGFHLHSLDVKKVPDTRFAKGFRQELVDPKPVFPAASWPPGETPIWWDILQAINIYSNIVRRGINTECILHHTDREKGIFRSGGVEYVMEMGERDEGLPNWKQPVKEVYLYTNILRSGTLLNHYGATPHGRVVAALDPAVGLFELEERRSRSLPPKRWRFSKIPVTPRAWEDAYVLIQKHFPQASLRYIRNQEEIRRR